jgi:hypothetical protein
MPWFCYVLSAMARDEENGLWVELRVRAGSRTRATSRMLVESVPSHRRVDPDARLGHGCVCHFALIVLQHKLAPKPTAQGICQR